MKKTSFPILCLLFITLFFESGCMNFKAKPDNTKFYVLAPMVPIPLIWHETPPPPGPTIALGRIELPGYMENPYIATKIGMSEIYYAQNYRWAELIGPNIARVLAENLNAQINSTVYPAPWPSELKRDYDVLLTIYDFIAFEESQEIVINARWLVREPGTKKLIASAEALHFSQIHGGMKNYNNIVMAMNDALVVLSDKIADSIPKKEAVMPAEEEVGKSQDSGIQEVAI